MQQDGETGSGSDDTILKKPVLAALAAVGLIVLLAAAVMGAGTTIGSTGVNFTSGDVSGVNSLDGGGNTIEVTDQINMSGNALQFGDDSQGTSGEIFEAGGDALRINSYGNILALNPDSSQTVNIESNINMKSNNISSISTIDGNGNLITVNDGLDLNQNNMIKDASEISTYDSGNNDYAINITEKSEIVASSGRNMDIRQKSTPSIRNILEGGGSFKVFTTNSGGGNTERFAIDGGVDTSTVNIQESNVDLNSNNITSGEMVESNQFTTVHNTSLAAIDEAIDEYNYVKLRPVTYNGTSTISIDASDRDQVVLDARGAIINYAGTGTAIQSINQGFDGRIKLLGGELVGPESGHPNFEGTTGIYTEDAGKNTFEISQLRGFEIGIHLNNSDRWSEGNLIRIESTTEQNRTLMFTGNENQQSFRNTQIHVKHAHAIGNGTLIYQDQADIYDSNIYFSGFIPEDGLGWFVNGSLGNSLVRFDVEVNNNSRPGDGVEFGSAYPSNGVWINPVIREGSNSQKWINPDDNRIPRIGVSGGGRIDIPDTIATDGIVASTENNISLDTVDAGNIKTINDASWEIDGDGGSTNIMNVRSASNEFRFVPESDDSQIWGQVFYYDFDESSWGVNTEFKIKGNGNINITSDSYLQYDSSSLPDCGSNKEGAMMKNETDGELYYCDTSDDGWEQVTP